jgi:hypothetical protein
MTPTWDILITSIPHRHEKLLKLLAELDRQVPKYEGVGVILYRDDLEVAYGDKTRALIEASAADYVSCVDDDDMVAPHFVQDITFALLDRPDYVGFQVLWTRDGIAQRPVIHSLAYNGWADSPELLIRDITQFNPIRRELALHGKWAGGYEAERRWGDRLREAGAVKTEVFIDERLYWYQESSGDTFTTSRQSLGVMPELPSYPWLKQIGPYA